MEIQTIACIGNKVKILKLKKYVKKIEMRTTTKCEIFHFIFYTFSKSAWLQAMRNFKIWTNKPTCNTKYDLKWCRRHRLFYCNRLL